MSDSSKKKALDADSKKGIFVVAASIVAGLLIIGLFVLIIKRNPNKDADKVPDCDDPTGYETVVDKYFTAYNDRDMKSMMSCFPENIALDTEKGYATTAESDNAEDYWPKLEEYYGSDFVVSYNIEDVHILNNGEIDDLKQLISSIYYANYNLEYVVMLKVMEKVDGSASSTEGYEYMYAGVVDGTWQLLGNKID